MIFARPRHSDKLWFPAAVALVLGLFWGSQVAVADPLFPQMQSYGAGTSLRSVAIADLDGDGDCDLAVTTGGSVSILLNHGDGMFAPQVTYGVGNHPGPVAIADLDGDGDADLAVATRRHRLDGVVSILLNHGDGTFAAEVNYGVGVLPYSVAIADLNGDGDADLAVANQDDSDVSILLGGGDGTFAVGVTYYAGDWPSSVVAADLDGDGDTDLAVANPGDDTVSILLNQSGGCNGNRIPDECDLDCGSNGGPCDVPGCGQSEDCNANATPDECDINRCQDDPFCGDCNTNGTPDGCELGENLPPTGSVMGTVATQPGPAQAASLDAPPRQHQSCIRRENDQNGSCILDECEQAAPAVPVGAQLGSLTSVSRILPASQEPR
ncbi:MAG: VCBS repeat-containing protein [bacterium]|nr:VCBS repeat-containing protein [bacterium]